MKFIYLHPDPDRIFDWTEDENGELLDPRARQFEAEVTELNRLEREREK